MASRLGSEPKIRPDPGQILLVIHDFIARGSDELSLLKGDRVELVERDDDFGDGWYLGKHLTNGNTGLFPEVYTKPAPRGPPAIPAPVSIPRSIPITQEPSIPSNSSGYTQGYEPRKSVPTPEADKTAQINRHVSASQVLDTSKVTTPLITSTTYVENGNGNGMTIPTSSLTASSLPRSLSLASSSAVHGHGQDSPVMNETLSVIQEHISDMNAPRQMLGDRHGATDSGSEYSSNIEHRLSYIAGEETDEEEETMHSEAEVEGWNAFQVAEYLSSVGVEEKHCNVFREQEISGDVLLGMDQTSVFLKEFDLGSVGRRLKTWQKIKALQDEIKGTTPSGTRRTTQNYGSDVGSEDTGRSRTRSIGTAPQQKLPNSSDRPGSRQNSRYSGQQNGRMDSMMSQPPLSPTQGSSRPQGEIRPSAASIRDLNHSRRHSSIDSSVLLQQDKPNESGSPITPGGHKKLPSFDRNWTMGSDIKSPTSAGPLSSASPKVALTEDDISPPGANLNSPFEFDRGYFSGGDIDGRPRNVLKKKTGSHSRNSSYTDEQRIRSATTNARHSRFGSVDSIRDPHVSPAGQKYYGMPASRRTPSAGSIRPMPPPKDPPSPIVTKLDGTYSPISPSTPQSPGWLHAVKPSARGLGLRAISDAVTGNEKSRISSPVKEDSLQSPSRAGSSTTSGGPSFELDSPDNSKSPNSSATTAGNRTSRKKSKKETSAYTRGLEKKTPQEQMADCDFSGWMKKKNTNLMTTWKPRLFILKGRRLSYYYSENDEQEQGLIDISFHRVLPADNDRLTGLHATLTGATTSPTSPDNAHTPTTASIGAAAEPQSSIGKPSADTMFIFKLVPPRAGLSRAVTFTKPTVHYFAVPNITIGRLWMAALMKATIDRDDTKPVTTTYQQKTITLAKARQMRHRPPALMNLDEKVEEEPAKTPVVDLTGLNIHGIIFDKESQEGDSGVSGVSKHDSGILTLGNRTSREGDTSLAGQLTP